MLNNLTNNLPLTNDTLYLLWQRSFRIIILFARARDIQIHRRTLTGKNLRPQTLPSEINLRRVDLIEHYRWQGAQDLHFEFGGFNYIDAAYEGVNNEREGGGVVNGDGVCFADDADGGFCAA